MKKTILPLLFSMVTMISMKAYQPETSVAGFFPVENSGRSVYQFNTGWRYYQGDVAQAEGLDFDDSQWAIVSTPHTVQLMPAEASGCRNYQGKAWYRKRFVVDASLEGKWIQLYFEAVMGRANLYLNGQHVMEHIGGYLPFALVLNDYGIKAGDTCLVALCADNSNDKSYPPGKTQYTLDFTYHGGIYRDVWLIAKGPAYITDAVVERHETAGGGVFIHYDKISEKSAQIYVETELANRSEKKQNLVLEAALCDKDGVCLKRIRTNVGLNAGAYQTVQQQFSLSAPQLWSPESPYQYQIQLQLKQGKQAMDGGMLRAGIRLVEFKGREGFWLNGKPYHRLVGTNRHQDFAYVGNALPNSQHWRDVKLLREAGCTIIRSAHYPQDPAFMDACDELGIFMIVPTPGWQFWNRDPQFQAYVYDDIQQMIRRDRNHTSVLMWEPILNETRFPKDFSMQALQLTKDEFPYPGAPVAAADRKSEGVADNYGLVYGWPADTGLVDQCIFTREFGEYVDDWYAHNCLNRVSRSWGEVAQVTQSLSLAQAYSEMYRGGKQFIGGAQWHSFDHQRGYHPDPYWGGLADCFRQPKYSYYMFKSQVPADWKSERLESGPMVYIAHEIMPTSNNDVLVFSNCDSVRLIIRESDTIVKPVLHPQEGMPNEPVVFEGAYDFWKMREMSYIKKNYSLVSFIAEGIIDGQVVCTTKKMPSRRSTKLRLSIDHAGQSLVADGSDFVVVVAEVTDDNGNVRRLAKDNIFFTVEGEGHIIGDASIGANPRAVEFGSAPVLIRSTQTPGKITVKARVQYEGQMAPSSTEITFESVAAAYPACDMPSETASMTVAQKNVSGNTVKPHLSKDEANRALQEVERQQTDFGENK